MLASVVIPALNEGKTILAVLAGCVALPIDKEIIIVDNNSTDDTRRLVAEFIHDNDLGRTVCLARESARGKGAALRKGIQLSRGDAIVFQDADCEYDPASIPELVEQLTCHDVVFGCRMGRLYAISASAFIANKLLATLVNRRFNVSLGDIFTGQRAFRREALDRMGISSDGFDVETELTVKTLAMGYRWTEIDVPYVPRDRESGKKIGGPDLLTILWRYLLVSKGMRAGHLLSYGTQRNAIKQPDT